MMMPVPPPFDRCAPMHLPIHTATGFDTFIFFLPEKWAARIIARRIAKTKALPGVPGAFSFSFPGSDIWEILDVEGKSIRKYKGATP
jgi:hypothetical protein